MQDGFRLEFTDKNYNCLPYLDAVLDSRTHVFSFFSGCGGLDIGAQMAGIKVLSSLDFAKDAVETMNKFFAHACHMLNDIRNVTRQASWLHNLCTHCSMASQSALRRNIWSYIKTPKRSSQKQNHSISKSR